MKILSRDEVIKELGAVPGELTYDFYIKEVDGREVLYRPIKSRSI